MKTLRILIMLTVLLSGCRITTLIQGKGVVASPNGTFFCSEVGGDCFQKYTSPTIEILLAAPAPGYTFARWTGCNYVSLTSCATPIIQSAITQDLAWDITATFKPLTPPVQAASYTYNALGQRITKTTAGVTTIFQYDLDGNLLAELNASGQPLRQHIHLNGVPIAQVSSNTANSTSAVQYVHADHLGTPSLMTDQNRVVVADIEATPFGEIYIDYATVVHNRRFPGQYKDEESGLHYNYHREYDPTLGRYIQSDPIGLVGGINTYWYANANPVMYVDPNGWDSYLVSRALGGDSKIFSHNFVVANANYAGDPNADVYSYGQNNQGNTGLVDQSTKGFSKGTSHQDRAFWRSLESGRSCSKSFLGSSTRIYAADTRVQTFATSLVENTDYAAVGAVMGTGTNSNSAASAVSNAAQGSRVPIPGGGRLSPGASQAGKMKFDIQ